jgi:hypothetical protein
MALPSIALTISVNYFHILAKRICLPFEYALRVLFYPKRKLREIKQQERNDGRSTIDI